MRNLCHHCAFSLCRWRSKHVVRCAGFKKIVAIPPWLANSVNYNKPKGKDMKELRIKLEQAKVDRDKINAEIQKLEAEIRKEAEHKWVHGDVFSFNTGGDSGTMLYVHPFTVPAPPIVIYIDKDIKPYKEIEHYLKTAKFLFNIKDKL